MTRLTALNRVAQKLMKHFGEERTIAILDKHFENAYRNYKGSTRHMFEYLWNAATTEGVQR